jgi:hypothetical protein
VYVFTAVPYKTSTGPEQGFPWVVFPHREKPVFITGFPVAENRFFPVRITTQGKPCFHQRVGFAVLYCTIRNISPQDLHTSSLTLIHAQLGLAGQVGGSARARAR